MEQIKELLQFDKDARLRELNGTDLLIKYPQEFKVMQTPNIPRIKSPNRTGVLDMQNNIDKFNSLFYNKFPQFEKVDFSNILIAGGCISSILLDVKVCDIDIFFYGLSPDDATNKMLDVIDALNPDEEKVIYTKNKYNLTVKIDGTIYQFIFRCYKSISQILHGFDIASSAIGFDGKQLYTTKVGDFAFSTAMNIVDLTKRSPTYETRLAKYCNRGFSIGLPNFDMSKFASEVKELQPTDKFKLNFGKLKVGFEARAIDGNCIIGYPSTECNYSLVEYSDDDNMSIHAIEWANIKRIVAGKLDEVIYRGSNLIRLKLFEETGVIAMYEKVMKKAYDTRGWQINAKSLARLNPTDNIGKIITWILGEEKEKYDLFVQKRILDIKLTMQSMKYEISWITKNPGSQTLLTSSINPMITDPKEWYDSYYVDI